MPIKIEWWKARIAAGYTCLFGGRMARATFALRAAILIGVVFVVAAPIDTVLAPSTKTLRDAYGAAAFLLAIFCSVGLLSAYVRRLHDMGLKGYWAFAALVLIPAAIIGAGAAYQDHRYSLDNAYNTAELNELLGFAALIAPFIIAMWRGDQTENRFGPVPPPIEHALTSRFSVLAAAGAAIILIPACIYAGLFQDGIWIGRGGIAPSMPMMQSNVPGVRFMKCWNVKGVGAGSGEGPGSGVYRDGYSGNMFDFLVTPNGQIDIAMAGERGGNSFLADGFKIVPYGLRMPADGSAYISVRDLDRFMLVAVFDQGGPGGAINYTAFTFARNRDTWPEYHVVMTSALSSSANAIALAKFPEARGRIMIGDCMPG